MVDGRARAALIALAVACGGRLEAPKPAPIEPAAIELVESQPVETTLDSDLPDAHTVWLAMIQGARTSIDLAEFYVSNAPGSRLEPIVQALEAAIARGVRVRLLVDITFVRTYPETIERLQRSGAQLRTLDLSGATGGILHAKYFIVDGGDAYLGSQNLDWRSLEHIEELGVRIHDRHVVDDLAAVFAADWARAGSEPAPAGPPAHADAPIQLVASPEALLPPGVRWDLKALVAMIATAKRTIRVQLLTYLAGEWTELEAPLLAAAARGVHVELLVADWSKRPKTLPGLQQLARTPNVEIRFVAIPQSATGFIPFARVAHAKLMVVDRAVAWVGTSNWEREYFYESRNVGLVIGVAAIAERIATWSDATWTSSYATRVEPDVKYTAPRIAE